MAATARGDRAAAYDAFMGAVCGPDHRSVVADVLGADGLARAERDSDVLLHQRGARGQGLDAGRPARDRRARPCSSRARRARPRPTGSSPGSRACLPDAEVATVEGANHLLPLTHPREVADLVTSGRVAAAR